MIDDILPSGTYHVMLNFITKRGPRYLMRVVLLPTGEGHEFTIWPSQFDALVEALVGQHHPETGITNAQLLLDVECRQRKDKTGPYNRIAGFHRPANLIPMESSVQRPTPIKPQDF